MRPLLAALLFYVLFIGIVRADDQPTDIYGGSSYEDLSVAVLRWSNPAAGDIGTIVTQASWKAGGYVEASTALTTFIIHWPRNADDTARAIDVMGIRPVGLNGTSVFGYWMPEGLSIDSTQESARVEITVTAFRPSIWPGKGFGSTFFSMDIP